MNTDFLLKVLAAKLIGKAVDVGYPYLKDFVRAIVLYWLFVQFIALFIASYQEQKGLGNSPVLLYPSH